ncbi:probable polygalacturonase [Camellia sinensis]|uniref:probable polygalacturonase n=1 Tax=Camellia sinensis TaxID=4442 RepID=UPI001035E44A|nr:probable polygalacturonase [Camellia sinensis]
MSGGISNILAEHLHLHDSFIGVEVKTSRGRGGYVKDILISDVEMANVDIAIEATGQFDSHPDEKFDPDALPVVQLITFKDIVGTNITTAGMCPSSRRMYVSCGCRCWASQHHTQQSVRGRRGPITARSSVNIAKVGGKTGRSSEVRSGAHRAV